MAAEAETKLIVESKPSNATLDFIILLLVRSYVDDRFSEPAYCRYLPHVSYNAWQISSPANFTASVKHATHSCALAPRRTLQALRRNEIRFAWNAATLAIR